MSNHVPDEKIIYPEPNNGYKNMRNIFFMSSDI